jgi:DNA-binding transcriptional ArsR family regulator
MADSRAIDRIFHALGDANRRAILERLTEGPATVSHFAGPFSLTLAAVVQHLQILKDAGLVATEKVGRVRTCKLDPAGFRLAEQWIRDRRTIWEQRLDALGEILGDRETYPHE